MNIAVLNTYNINFQKAIHLNKEVSFLNSPNTILNQFAYETSSIEDIDDTIDAINLVLNGTESFVIFSTDSFVTLKVEPLETKFYENPNFNPQSDILFSISTLDLKEIVLSWKEYLNL